MEFQVCSWFAKDIELPSTDKDYHSKHVIVMFGRDMEGRSVACTVHDFLPHFFVKIKKAGWTAGDLSKLTEELEFKMGYRFKNCIADARIVRKKEFWGFTDNSEFSFARICFKTEMGMRVAAKAFANGNVSHPKQRAFKLYESNILPFLRFAHMQNVSPAGWVKVSKPIDALDVDVDVGPKTQVSVHVNWKHVHGIPNKAAISPLRILAVDIECMSSDGDFPVPRKTYIKVASDIYGAVKQHQDPKQLKSNQKQEMCKRAIVDMLAEKFEDGALKTLYSDQRPTRDALDRLVRQHYEHMDLIIGGDKTIMQQALKDRFMANPVLQNKYSAFLQTFARVAAKSTSATSTRLQMDAWCKAQAAKVHMKDADLIEKDAPGILNIAFGNKDGIVDVLTHYLSEIMPQLRGDEIIQIGMTVHKYGDSECCDRVMLSLGSCSAIPGCKVVECKNERELLRAWVKETEALDPDVVCGYNVLGFDFHFIYERCEELGIADDMQRLSRLRFQPAEYKESKLSSSALGDNLLKYFDMPGRTCIDVMKVVQRDHKLDSYKLDSVATHFMGMCKGDVSPAEIFKLYLGTADDRARIAKYCIQDCELCNHLVMKLEIIANNMGMANVCCVPMHFIFMRGQGVKIFSLVAQQCKSLGYLIPTKVVDEGVEGDGLEGGGEESAVGYEGAIVLPPKSGIYIENPVAVLDYASLYPSSMISENLSHDRIVLDAKYDNLEGVEYTDVAYDIYEGKGDEKRKVGERVCRYAQGDMGVIPHILQHLLKQRKETRKRMTLKSVRDSAGGGTCVVGYWNEEKREVTLEDGSVVHVSADTMVDVQDHFDVFQKAVLDGLQNAYKVTANSLYGQVGSRTSPIYLKDIAACTTATGRKMILLAKKFLEDEYGAKTVYGDSVVGYTPTILKVDGGKRIVVEKIENVAERYGGGMWIPCVEEGRQDKESCELGDGVMVWTSTGWTPLKRVIRHKLAEHKSIIRVLTHTGVVDVTDEHSLLDPSRKKIDAKEVRVGDVLLHRDLPEVGGDGLGMDITEDKARIMGMFMGDDGSQAIDRMDLWSMMYDGIDKVVPRVILNSRKDIRQAFWNGFCDINGNLADTIDLDSQVSTATLWMLATSLGYLVSVSVDAREDKTKTGDCYRLRISSGQSLKNSDAIKKLQTIEYDGYVYDFTTENHEFSAGVGRMIVSNTDSLFVYFPDAIKEEAGKARVEATIKIAAEASRAIKPLLKKPHDLEYEKTYWPFILFSKKRYVANQFGLHTRGFKQSSMGIVLKRRDNANIVKRVYGGIIDIILNRHDVASSTAFLIESLQKLIKGEFPLEDLVVSKSLRAHYKDPTRIAHKVLADRIKERSPGSAPQVNDRIPYVYVIPEKNTSKKPGGTMLQGDRIEHPDYIKERGLVPDYEVYISNQIMNPVVQIYALDGVLETLAGYDGPSAAEWSKIKAELEREKSEKYAAEKCRDMREARARKLLFDPILRKLQSDPMLIKLKNKQNGNQTITDFFLR